MRGNVVDLAVGFTVGAAFSTVALAMFFLIRISNRLDAEMEEEFAAEQAKEGPEMPSNKKCPYCLQTIPYQATRCPQCTSRLEAAPEGNPPAA